MARGKGTALGPNEYLKRLFSAQPQSAPKPNALQRLLVGSILSKQPGNLAHAAANEDNSGSSNRVGFGLSDFGMHYVPPGQPAPNVAGQGRNSGHKGPNLQQLAIDAITKQYGPVLGELANEEGSLRSQAAKDRADAQNRGARAEGDVATLYGRLRQYAGNTQRAQDQDYRAGVRGTRRTFGNLRKQINNTYSESGGDLSSELKRMGLDNAAALAGAAKDLAFTQSMVKEDRANQVGNTRASRREYDAGMGRMKNDIIATGNAAVGTQRSQTNATIADVQRQLTSNIMQLAMQRAQIQGQQAGALANLKLTQAQSKAAAKDPMKHLEMLYKQAQIAKMLGQGSASGTQGKGPGKGMADALAYLQGLYPNTNANWSTQKKTQLSSMLEDLMNNASKATSTVKTPSGDLAYWDPKYQGDLKDALFAQMAGVMGPKGNKMYGREDQNNMLQALMIALGNM